MRGRRRWAAVGAAAVAGSLAVGVTAPAMTSGQVPTSGVVADLIGAAGLAPEPERVVPVAQPVWHWETSRSAQSSAAVPSTQTRQRLRTGPSGPSQPNDPQLPAVPPLSPWHDPMFWASAHNDLNAKLEPYRSCPKHNGPAPRIPISLGVKGSGTQRVTWQGTGDPDVQLFRLVALPMTLHVGLTDTTSKALTVRALPALDEQSCGTLAGTITGLVSGDRYRLALEARTKSPVSSRIQWQTVGESAIFVAG